MGFALSQQTGINFYNFVTRYGGNGNGSYDNSTALSNALADISSKGGGILFVPAGSYNYTTSVTWNVSNVMLLGAGAGATKFVDNSAGGVYLFTLTNPSSGDGGLIAFCTWQGFAVDQGMSGGHTAGGVFNARGLKNCTFRDLHLTNWYDYAMYLQPNSVDGTTFGHNNYIENCLFDNAMTSAGAGCAARITSADEHSFIGNQFQYCGGATLNSSAVRDQSGLTKYLGCTFVNGREGIRIQDCSNSLIDACVFDGCLADSVHLSGESNTVSNCIFTSGGQAAADTSSFVAIETYGAKARCTVSANYFASNSSGNSLRSFVREYNTTSGENTIVGNTSKINNALGHAAYEILNPKTTYCMCNGGDDRTVNNVANYYNVRDYGALGDGTTDDSTAITTALAAAAANGGGVVFFPPGNYKTGAFVLKNHVWVKGGGMKTTTLTLKNGANSTFITNFVSPDGIQANAEYCGVEGLFLECNGTNQTGTCHGIEWSVFPTTTGATNDDNFDTHQVIRDVSIWHARNDGFYAAAGRGYHVLENVECAENSGNGFTTGDDSEYIACVAGTNGLAGFEISNGSSTRFTNCKAFYNGQVTTASGIGFDINSGVYGIQLVNCCAQDNWSIGFSIVNVSQIVMSGCVADSNSKGSAGTYPGIDIWDSTYCQIECTCLERKADGVNSNQQTAVRIRSNSYHNILNITHSIYPGSGATIGQLIDASSDADSVAMCLWQESAHTNVVTAAAGSNAGTSPPAPVVVANSSDLAGKITFGSGTSPAAGNMVVVTFNKAFISAPFVTLSPTNTATQGKGVYLAAVSTTSFTVGFTTAAAASQANTVYGVNYKVDGLR